MRDQTTIWGEVSDWPPEQRRALAVHLLRSLEQDKGIGPVSRERQQALQQLIGIWKTQQPPDDEQAEQILRKERMKKYG